jgi:hypothetical protein
MSTGGATDTDPADDFPSDLDGESSCQNENIIVHIPQSLCGRHLRNHLGQVAGRPTETGGGIGFFHATLNRVGTGSISSHQGSQNSGAVNNSDRDSMAIFLAPIQRS